MNNREKVLERNSQELDKVTKRLSKLVNDTGAAFEVIGREAKLENSDAPCVLCPPELKS